MTTATVLTLHGIECEALTPLIKEDPAIQRYILNQSQFDYLLRLLSSRNCKTVQEFTDLPDNTAVVLTFDDGLISDYEMVLPLLSKYHIKASFYITARNIGKPGYCGKSQLREMVSAGMEIGSHGLTHRYLTLMPEKEAKSEIKESKDIIEQVISQTIHSYAAVGGHFRGWMVDYAYQTGYQSFATMVPGKTAEKKHNKILKLNRNHFQESHDRAYIKNLVEADYQFFLKNKLHYYALYLPKVVFGLRNYNRLKSLILGNAGVTEK